MSPTNQHSLGREWRPALWLWLVWTIAASVALHWWNREVINTDAIAYLRIADYYATADFELAVNGYWGPLLSWLMVPFLKSGLPPLIAARSAMLISTLVFVTGANQMLAAFGPAKRAHVLGLTLCCLAGAVWGSQNITPDLLMAGLALVALPLTRRAFGEHDSRAAGLAGLAWGAAYLAKAVALPWAALIVGIHALIQWRRRLPGYSSVAILCGGIALVALPWIFVVSVQAGHVTFSTSGRIAHSITGRVDEYRYHPTFVTLHRPRPGRLTSWENPAELLYHHWSPFESQEDFARQIRVMTENVFKILFIITSLVPVWPLIVLIWFLSRSFNARESAVQAVVPLFLLCLIYLPVYLTFNEQRYFYVSLPLLWIALNAARRSNVPRPVPVLKDGVQTLAFSAILLALLASTIMYQYPARTAGMEAHQLARWLELHGHAGPVAGSGMRPGGRAGLFTAWFLGQPWLGDSQSTDPLPFLQTGARLLVLSGEDPRIANWSHSSKIQSLELPASLAEKLVVFEVKP